jgi:hypothetical protein
MLEELFEYVWAEMVQREMHDGHLPANQLGSLFYDFAKARGLHASVFENFSPSTSDEESSSMDDDSHSSEEDES